jgi:hypothetical protein
LKPKAPEAMEQLIGQIKEAIPFGMPEAEICARDCFGCPKKLLEYLDTELEFWESELASGETPTLGDIDRLAKSSKKIYKALKKNDLV